MSTKMSTDIITNRSTTRLHAPPGGASTISFGDEATATKANPVAQTPKAEPKATAPAGN
jgi:hypothetical protein